MRIFLPPFEVGDTEGFTPEKDLFGRAKLGEGMTNLLASVSDPIVLALDGQWGSGKTTFLKMWAGELRRAGFPVVYLDAFQNDYEEDAFTAVASEIIALADAQQKGRTKAGKAFVDKAIGAGKVILRSGLKLGTKAATLGALDGADFEGIASELASEASALEDKYIGELLTKQKQQKEAIQAFRDSLADLPALLTRKSPDDPGPKPLVIIVDELDRCRPSFALKLLERIKHFFAVPNVHFVLGVHLAQLRNSVKVAYGADINANLYLQKFVQVTIHLLDHEQRSHQWAITKYLNYLIEKLEIKAEHRDLVDQSKAFILHVARARDLSLRSIDRIVTTLALALASSRRIDAPGDIFGGLCVLKNTDPDLFIRAKRGILTFDEVRVKLGFDVTPDKTLLYSLDMAESFWKYFTGDAAPAEHENDLRRWFGVSSGQLLALAANNVVDRLQLGS
jgi:hypothetical protein